MPHIFVVNKMDRPGADFAQTLAALQDAYGRHVVAEQLPSGSAESFGGYVDLARMKAFRFVAEAGPRVRRKRRADPRRERGPRQAASCRTPGSDGRFRRPFDGGAARRYRAAGRGDRARSLRGVLARSDHSGARRGGRFRRGRRRARPRDGEVVSLSRRTRRTCRCRGTADRARSRRPRSSCASSRPRSIRKAESSRSRAFSPVRSKPTPR